MPSMSSSPEPRQASRILYVPGIRAKPPPAIHRAMLWRCVLEGVQRADPLVAASLAGSPGCLRLALWGHLLYDEYADPAPDVAALGELLATAELDRGSIAEVLSLRGRVEYLAYRFADRFPGLIDWLAAENTRINMEDARRYFRNADGIGDRIRDVLRVELQRCWAAGDRLLLMTHSFGSVIAWDTLRSLNGKGGPIDLFLTLGSPLGTHYIRRRLTGTRAQGAARYPQGIRRWHNLAAIGDLTALGHEFGQDFAEMRRLGLVAEISDRTDLVNPFREKDGLNVHRCYGYFANRATGGAIASWWREA